MALCGLKNAFNEHFCVFVWQLAGVREGDVIIGIGDEDVKWSSHEQVVSLIKAAKNVLSLRLIQPIEKPVHSKVNQVRYLHGSFAYGCVLCHSIANQIRFKIEMNFSKEILSFFGKMR
jgi:PDZ domain